MFNFLVLGVDSVSRLNFVRHMPRTRRFLLEELDAVELAGFNKVIIIILYMSHLLKLSVAGFLSVSVASSSVVKPYIRHI